MDEPHQLPPQLARILLQVAAPHASLLALVADGCEDADIPSLALMRSAKLQSKYCLSPQQALRFASLCAEAAAPATCLPRLAHQHAALPSNDLPQLIEVGLDSILADNNEMSIKLNPRASSSSPPQSSSHPAPPLHLSAVLDPLQLKIVRRSVAVT
jgi:hypothetical protein